MCILDFKKKKMKNKTLTLMKMNRIFTFFTIIAMSFAVTSCVEDDDYTVPSSLGDEENTAVIELLANATEVSMANVKAMYTEGDFIEAVDQNVYVKGYVSSSDLTGNFYKEFFIQDSPTDPTIALKVLVSQADSYNRYNLGREVYINLNGLFVGEERVGNGVTTIGGGIETDQYGTTVTALDDIKLSNQVLRSAVTETLTPKVVTFAEISNNLIGVLVNIENVEFADNLAGETYFDSVNDLYDTQRTLQACGGFNYSEFKLETSGFANFINEVMPTGNGDITAIVNKTFDGASLVLALNSADDVNFTAERCTLLDNSSFTVLFEEDFESAVNNTDLDFTDWTNFGEAGGWLWREKTFDGNGYTEFSSFNSGDASNIVWLVTPGIDMDAQENEFLNFETAQHHLDSSVDNTLEVFISTDYDGSNVLAATWEPLGATLVTEANSWYEFVDSGLINISSYTGTAYIAFKVVGNSDDLAGGYQIDNLSIISTN